MLLDEKQIAKELTIAIVKMYSTPWFLHKKGKKISCCF